jgi:hypothetical protein
VKPSADGFYGVNRDGEFLDYVLAQGQLADALRKTIKPFLKLLWRERHGMFLCKSFVLYVFTSLAGAAEAQS